MFANIYVLFADELNQFFIHFGVGDSRMDRRNML